MRKFFSFQNAREFVFHYAVYLVLGCGALGLFLVLGMFLDFWQDMLPWAVVFIGLGLIGLAFDIIASRERIRSNVCVNSALIIERHELKLIIQKNHRDIFERIQFKATRSIDAYFFKFYWTGNAKDVKIAVSNDSMGFIARDYPPHSKVFPPWQPFRFTFKPPLEKGEVRTIVFRYSLDDPAFKAYTYHMVSYAHVKACRTFKIELSFEPSELPSKVYLVRFSETGTPFAKEEVLSSQLPDQYVVEEKPRPGQRYSVEWENN